MVDPVVGAVYDAVMSGLGNRQRTVSGPGPRADPVTMWPAPCEPRLCLFLLGGFRVERHGQALPAAAWGRRAQAKTLVKLLALTPGHQLHREELLEWLWPEADLRSARNRFAKALYAARHALEPDLPPREESSYLHHRDDLLSLDLTRIWIDVDHFEQLAAAALASDTVSDYEAALTAYGGPLLPAVRYADWAAARREALAARYLQLLLCLAETLERHGILGPACERLRQALALDPAGEKAHYRLMRLYALTGSRHQAIRQYHLCRAALEEELGTVPEPATEALYQQLLLARESVPDSLEADRGAVEIPRAAPRLLPLPLIGREWVLEILLEALDAAGS
jgi:DNA-binding SARP family transcriptional activator